MSITARLQLNARLQPVHRGEIFEDPLDQELSSLEIGSVTGGGTAMGEAGEITSCDIEMELEGELDDLEDVLVSLLEAMGVPKGSVLHLGGQAIELGYAEGLALYLNGTDLPEEVYETSDINDVVAEIDRLLGEEGDIASFWEGPTETALYAYGHSFQDMKRLIDPLLAQHPLCQGCRVVQIA